MANTLLTISMITREALRVLENQLTFTKYVNRQYSDKFGVEGAKIGTVLNVRKPPRYVGRTGQAINIEDATETQVPVTLNKQFGVDIQFSSQDLALSIDDFSKRFISPAIATVANQIDFDGLQLYKTIYQLVGTPGTVPTALLTYLNAGVALDNSAAPRDKGGRTIITNPQMQASIIDALKGLFNTQSSIGKQTDSGEMTHVAGFNWDMDQNVGTQVWGVQGGAPAVNGANQVGSSLVTNAWTAAALARLNIGDVFTVAGVFSVNPMNKQSTGALQQFVATAVGSSDGSGAMTIAISPAIVVTGGSQNVTASPANGALLTLVGAASSSSPQGLAFHRDAFTLATADLPLPGGVDMAARISDPQLGMSVRMVRAYNISTDQFPCRLDVLYGWSTLRPELAVRIAS